MDDIEKAAAASKDWLTWAASYLPVELGWVILGVMVVLSAGYLIKSWRGK